MADAIVSLVLASGSPRRIRMLEEAGARVRVVPPQVAEDLTLNLHPRQMVLALALRKGQAVEEALLAAGELQAEDLIVSADTVVALGREILGKPESEARAFETLQRLRGRQHAVYTGVCLLKKDGGLRRLFVCCSQVFFKDYSDGDIHRYVATGEPMDKAGAYAIQGGFACQVEHLEGLLSNVIGFPLEVLEEELAALHLRLS